MSILQWPWLAERQGQNAVLQFIQAGTGNDEIAVSVVTVLELVHGIVRADTVSRRDKRQRFLDELMSVVPVHAVTVQVGMRAGQIDGYSQAKGVRIPLSDLLIGVTALELGYAVVTHNVRHFRMIPNLVVNQF